jgi:hypothetical protein
VNWLLVLVYLNCETRVGGGDVGPRPHLSAATSTTWQSCDFSKPFVNGCERFVDMSGALSTAAGVESSLPFARPVGKGAVTVTSILTCLSVLWATSEKIEVQGTCAGTHRDPFATDSRFEAWARTGKFTKINTNRHEVSRDNFHCAMLSTTPQLCLDYTEDP